MDAGQAKELLKGIGFSIFTPVIKNRKKYMYKVFEIVIDDVKGLGRFAEIELKEDFDDTDKAFEKIFDLLRQIGLKKIETLKRGYVSLIWNPDHDFSVIKEV
ncbi:class IV adenylate cyclase [Candidatus Dojkabacteria bacterium]|nr:class IV adenylate cyclase [Candidatus Dojkabacteria bacterium]